MLSSRGRRIPARLARGSRSPMAATYAPRECGIQLVPPCVSRSIVRLTSGLPWTDDARGRATQTECVPRLEARTLDLPFELHSTMSRDGGTIRKRTRRRARDDAQSVDLTPRGVAMAGRRGSYVFSRHGQRRPCREFVSWLLRGVG